MAWFAASRRRFSLAAPPAIILAAALCGCASWGQPGRMQARALTIPYSRAHDLDALQSPDAVERRWAILRLMERGDSAAADEIAPLLSSEHEEVAVVRAAAATALRAIGGPDQIPALLAGLDDADPLVRREIVAAIGAIGAPDIAPALAPMLRDRDIEVRLQTIESLKTIAGPAAIPRLIPAMEDPAADVRFAARVALIDLAGSDHGRASARWKKWWDSGIAAPPRLPQPLTPG